MSWDDEFFRRLARLDQGIADRWKKVSGGKLRTPIGPNGLDAIVLPVFKTKKISANQAEALGMLMGAGDGARRQLNDEAVKKLLGYAAEAYEEEWFTATDLVTSDDLREFHAALGMGNVSRINFVSPGPGLGTGLSYSPNLYTAIRQLVQQGRIKVRKVDAGQLGSRGGLYQSDINRLTLYSGLRPEFIMPNIVHEATHAIQDWRNTVALHKYTEADAYIAQAAAAMSVSKQVFHEYEEQAAAGALVLAGQATAGNGDWIKAYGRVVEAVERDGRYIFVKDLSFDSPLTRGREIYFQDENAVLQNILRQLNMADDILAWLDLRKSWERIARTVRKH